MASDDTAVFIDTQLDIDLYRTESGKDLLALLQEQKDHVVSGMGQSRSPYVHKTISDDHNTLSFVPN